jgi:ferredoxin--NADP+ reductase
MPDDKYYRARITQREDFAPDLWMVRIDPGGPFTFKPGQYATLGLDAPGKPIEKPYSIVSAPHERELEFFFELVQQGELTPLLHKLQVGDELLMRKAAKGLFTMDTKTGHTNHFLVCTVTGIAPFVSYVRALYSERQAGRFGGEHKLYVLTGASRSWELAYHREMERTAAEAPWLKYAATVSRPWEDPSWRGEVGRVDELIRKYADNWGLTPENTTAYLCGHPEMIEHGKGILKRRGFGKEALKEEVYWIPAKEAA